MKKIFFSVLIALVAIQGQAQRVIVHHVYDRPHYDYHDDFRHHHHHHDDDSGAATAAGIALGVVGIAALIGAAAESSKAEKAERAAEAQRLMEQRNIAQQTFNEDLRQADSDFAAGNYIMALQNYATCAQNNDYFDHMLGDQQKVVNRISECNARLNYHTTTPSVQNNDEARQANYGQYFADVKNPVCHAKNGSADVPRITRVSRNANEVRVEMEYVNTNYGATTVNIKHNTYIKGKNSGKLTLYRVENISVAPSNTTVQYGGQTLKFALIFPALDSQDTSFSLCEPSTDWKFDNIVCM